LAAAPLAADAALEADAAAEAALEAAAAAPLAAEAALDAEAERDADAALDAALEAAAAAERAIITTFLVALRTAAFRVACALREPLRGEALREREPRRGIYIYIKQKKYINVIISLYIC
jgi:hypothetical protein